jgi:hypothetical protein
MAKSGSRRQRSRKAIADGRVTGTRKVTRAEALEKGDSREDMENSRQRKLSKTIGEQTQVQNRLGGFFEGQKIQANLGT